MQVSQISSEMFSIILPAPKLPIQYLSLLFQQNELK